MATSGVSYAYIHCKPDGTPFYVGKGVRNRYKTFSGRNPWHQKTVEKYGQKNILIGRLECSSNEIALDLEIGLIKCFKRMGVELVNMTEGGEGNVGWECPETVKIAVAEANKKRVWTKEQRYAVGVSFRGKKRPEHSLKMRERGHWVKEKNPSYGKGYLQSGKANHMARAVVGEYNHGVVSTWPTLKDCADDLGVTVQAVCQAIKKGHKSKGWILRYS